jgi:hypothetical protein
VTITDVDDAFSMTINMDSKNASECFNSLGIDYERAVKYHGVVSRMNTIYHKNEIICLVLKFFGF